MRIRPRDGTAIAERFDGTHFPAILDDINDGYWMTRRHDRQADLLIDGVAVHPGDYIAIDNKGEYFIIEAEHFTEDWEIVK